MSILVLNRPGVISTFMLRPSGHWMSSQYFNCKQIASFIPAINCCPVTGFGHFEYFAPHCINPCSILVGAGSKHIILTIWGSAQDQHSPQGAMTLQNNAWFLAEGHSHSPKDYKYKDTLLVPWVLCEGVPHMQCFCDSIQRVKDSEDANNRHKNPKQKCIFAGHVSATIAFGLKPARPVADLIFTMSNISNFSTWYKESCFYLPLPLNLWWMQLLLLCPSVNNSNQLPLMLVVFRHSCNCKIRTVSIVEDIIQLICTWRKELSKIITE